MPNFDVSQVEVSLDQLGVGSIFCVPQDNRPLRLPGGAMSPSWPPSGLGLYQVEEVQPGGHVCRRLNVRPGDLARLVLFVQPRAQYVLRIPIAPPRPTGVTYAD